MTKLRLLTLIFIAACASSAWATGSNVYKCGTTYSQTPCDGAVAIQVDDTRSKEQKLQSDAAIVQQGKAANAMEKNRLKEEARAAAHNKPEKSADKSTAKVQPKTNVNADTAGLQKSNKGKKKESEFFTAKEAGPDKKK